MARTTIPSGAWRLLESSQLPLQAQRGDSSRRCPSIDVPSNPTASCIWPPQVRVIRILYRVVRTKETCRQEAAVSLVVGSVFHRINFFFPISHRFTATTHMRSRCGCGRRHDHPMQGGHQTPAVRSKSPGPRAASDLAPPGIDLLYPHWAIVNILK